MDLAAVILAGGTGVRLGGADKASLEMAGVTFLERALEATRAATEVVVVGEQVPTSRPATFVREDPPHGGPVAGLLAGRAALARAADAVVVLAVDMPRVTSATVDRLLAASEGHDGAVLCDGADRAQLAAVLRLTALDAAAPPDPHGASVGSLLAPMDLARVVGEDQEAVGVDTWEDLRDLPR